VKTPPCWGAGGKKIERVSLDVRFASDGARIDALGWARERLARAASRELLAVQLSAFPLQTLATGLENSVAFVAPSAVAQRSRACVSINLDVPDENAAALQ